MKCARVAANMVHFPKLNYTVKLKKINPDFSKTLVPHVIQIINCLLNLIILTICICEVRISTSNLCIKHSANEVVLIWMMTKDELFFFKRFWFMKKHCFDYLINDCAIWYIPNCLCFSIDTSKVSFLDYLMGVFLLVKSCDIFLESGD